ncbi:hypothetical protein HHI36_009923 [Cryptolaemus montrouzieri]|uniref:Uncharacterized protein n=1 Tax=Cryptolaemus montrouzieri TaxID=559131 RepID=A0ABD2MHC0_9CUCU
MRHYQRKTDRGDMHLNIMKLAANEVINEQKKLCQAAREYDMCRNSFERFIARYRSDPENVSYGYVSTRQVFTEEQENRKQVRRAVDEILNLNWAHGCCSPNSNHYCIRINCNSNDD